MSLFDLDHHDYVNIIELLELVVFQRRLQFPDVVRLHNGNHPLIALTFSSCGQYMDIEWRPHA